MSLRVLLLGGGTGGHLTPGLGLAEELQRRGHRCVFLTSGREVESQYLGEGVEHHSLGFDEGGMPRPLRLLRMLRRARRFAREYLPQLMIGLGGASSAAALAVRGRVPLVMLEGNYVVGRAVRWMQPFTRTTLTLFAQPATRLKRATCIGPIGRDVLSPPSNQEARQLFGLDPQAPVLLLMGGSQGAQDLNQLVARLAPDLAHHHAQVLACCGAGKSGPLREALHAAGVRAWVEDHCTQMGAAYAAADLAYCRGGASTLAELWLLRLPAVVVPYPYHKDRQQELNARALEPGVRLCAALDEGAGKDLLELLLNVEKRASMRNHLHALAPVDGRVRAAQLMEEIAAATA